MKVYDVIQLFDSYCWKLLLKDPTDELPEFADPEEIKIKYICDNLKEKLEDAPTIFNISKSPERFIPALDFICQVAEEEAIGTVEHKKKPRLFSLNTNPSLKLRHISINNK